MSSVTVDVVLGDGATTATVDYLLRFLQPGTTYTLTAAATGFPTVAPPSADVTPVAGFNDGPDFALSP